MKTELQVTDKYTPTLQVSDIKSPETVTDDELAIYKENRRVANKFIATVKEARMDKTRVLDVIKKDYINLEKSITQEAVEFSEALTATIQGKDILLLIERNKASMPERTARLAQANVHQFDEQAVLEMTDKEFDTFLSKHEDSLKDVEYQTRLTELGYDPKTDIISGGKIYTYKATI